MPESPRWLVSKDRDAKAVAALIKINQSDETYVPTEDIDDIRADHQASLAEGSGSWGELFSNPVEFRKLVCVFGILAGQQITGVQVRAMHRRWSNQAVYLQLCVWLCRLCGFR